MATLKLLAPLALIALFAVGVCADDKKDKPKDEPKPGGLGVMLGHEEGEKGFKITSVNGGSAAEKAGIKADDIVLKLDGKEVGEVGDFVMAIRAHKPGDKITLTIKRGDKEMEIKVTLGEAPKQQDN